MRLFKKTFPKNFLYLAVLISGLGFKGGFCASAEDEGFVLKTVVIDAGHGGKDPGAVSKDRKTYEKTLTLDISKRLKELINANCPGVNVILTRSGGEFVELSDRSAIANKKEADLFISIHINSCNSASPNGYSVHVLGKSSNTNRDLFAYNLDVCKKENSVIFLEDDYTTRYQGFDPSDPESFIFMQLMQNSNIEQSLSFAHKVSEALKGGPIHNGRGVWQDPFYVLWSTSMPSVLVELGFISNSTDLAALRSEKSRQDLAERLFNAFIAYKEEYDNSVSVHKADTASGSRDGAKAASEAPGAKAAGSPAANKPGTGSGSAGESGNTLRYGTQIFASSKSLNPADPRFLGYKPVVIRSGNIYKYVIGVFDDKQRAEKEMIQIRKKYPDAFPVTLGEEP